MKLMGILLLLFSCICYGYLISLGIKERLKAAEDFSFLINEMKNEMRFTHKAVREIVEKLNSTTKSPHIKKLFNGLGANQPIAELVADNLKFIPIDAEVKDTFNYFFANLGATDIEGQISHCELCKEKIDIAIVRVREESARKSKLVRSLSVLLGISLAILLY